RHMRVEAMDGRSRARNLGRADFRSAVDDLPLQVRERHFVFVDDAERTDAGSRKVQERRRAEAAGTHNENARALERGLAGTADFAQYDMPRIPLKLFGAEHLGLIAANSE